LHPEPIAFFGLKSQNKNCFSGLAPNPELALPVSSGRLQTLITRPGIFGFPGSDSLSGTDIPESQPEIEPDLPLLQLLAQDMLNFEILGGKRR
jgi:hypothetical protein